MKYLFLLGCSFALAVPAWAQEEIDPTSITNPVEPDEEEWEEELPHPVALPWTDFSILVTGTRSRIEQSGQSVSVVTGRELASVQGADLTRVLTRLPGVSYSRNGGLGAQTGLNIRGANADQLLVLIDGVRVADYASPGGGYDLGNLLGGNLSQVELLRGSNSVVWGSQAIGGVLAVTTEDPDGVHAAAEYGAYQTLLLRGGAGFGGSSHSLSLSAGYARTDGFSAQAGGTEADGYEQWNLYGKARLELDEQVNLHASGRYADSRLAIDLFGPNDPDFQDTREASGRVWLDFYSNSVQLIAGLAYADVRRDYETGFGPSSFTGRSWHAELRGKAEFNDELRLDFGADTDWTRSTSSFDPDASARQSSGHALLSLNRDRTSIAGGVRIDQHDRFGTHATFGANASRDIGGDWRLRASFGEGFKAPTLYQLYGSFVGNAALQPETSRSFEAGIERDNRNDRLHLAATVFRRDTRNLIDLDSSFVYQNVARARAEGVELEVGARLDENFRAQAAYTWLKARDLTNGRDLARRPRHALSFSADWATPLAAWDWDTPLARLTLGADLRLQGDSVEYDFLGTPIPLDGFAVATLRASLPLSERFELYGRVENVGNVSYETAVGFNSPGRSAYAGVRVRW